jgi:hypothetical protein
MVFYHYFPRIRIMKSRQIIVSLCSVAALSALTLADANAASIRITCEKGSGYSKISADGRGLVAGANYRARVKSGSMKTQAFLQQADINGEDEFDFSSKNDDINAGATAISSTFISGNPASVSGKIVDSAGFTVASDTVDCTVK